MLYYFEGKISDPLSIRDKQTVHKLEYSYLLHLTPTEIEWRKNVLYSFIFLTHPFDRLLSAYRNKFRDPYNTAFQE